MKIIGIGHRADDQSLLASKELKSFLWWEEFGKGWTVCVVDGVMEINSNDGLVWSSKSKDCLYVRFPTNTEDSSLKDLIILIEGFSQAENSLMSSPQKRPLSKPEQFIGLKEFAHPKTRITNCFKAKGSKRQIVKSISLVRSEVFEVDTCPERLDLPTMFQDFIVGRDLKINVRSFGEQIISYAVAADSDSVDYRYSQTKTVYKHVETPENYADKLLGLCEKYQAKLFDIDIRVNTNGEAMFLEFNSDPTFSCFEALAEQRSVYSKFMLAPLASVVVGGRYDRCLNRIYLHGKKEGAGLLRVSLENMNKTWSLILFNGQLFINHKDEHFCIKSVYLRPSNSENLDLQKSISEFLSLVELLGDRCIGLPSVQFSNGSKLRQTILSAHGLRSNTIKFPRARVVKGQSTKEVLENLTEASIVKSLSSQRSIVVDSAVFSSWRTTETFFIPTLFQEKIEGKDLRIHVMKDGQESVDIEGKSETDYRYAKERVFKISKTKEPLYSALNELREIEANSLIGVDLLEQNGEFYYLESNPGPAWEWFYGPQVCNLDRLITKELSYEAVS